MTIDRGQHSRGELTVKQQPPRRASDPWMGRGPRPDIAPVVMFGVMLLVPIIAAAVILAPRDARSADAPQAPQRAAAPAYPGLPPLRESTSPAPAARRISPAEPEGFWWQNRALDAADAELASDHTDHEELALVFAEADVKRPVPAEAVVEVAGVSVINESTELPTVIVKTDDWQTVEDPSVHVGPPMLPPAQVQGNPAPPIPPVNIAPAWMQWDSDPRSNGRGDGRNASQSTRQGRGHEGRRQR